MRTKLFTALPCLILIIALCLPALAEDVCAIDGFASVRSVSTDCSYIRLSGDIPEDVQVSVCVYDPSGKLIYQRNYGALSYWFESDDIYLPARTDGSYQAEVTVGSSVSSFSVQRTYPEGEDGGE